MAHIHEQLDYLMRREAPSDFIPDLVYRAPPGSSWPRDVLLLDYELSRLRRFNSKNVRCAEIAEIAGRFKNVLTYVYQFDAPSQVARDIHAASKKILPNGQLRVVVPPKGRPRKVEGFVRTFFAQTQAVKSAGSNLFICREPISKEVAEEICRIVYTDAASGRQIELQSLPGMFSCNRIDEGTSFLLTYLPELDRRKFLDVGCGYGVIGVTAAMRGASVVMLDADARAVEFARRNLALNSLAGEVVLSDTISHATDTFDFVFSNPPTHAGSPVLQLLFQNMVRVCRPTGYVAIVVREQLNYEKWLSTMGIVSRLGTSAGYKVLRIQKSACS